MNPRVWLLPNGNVVTSSTDPMAEYWIHVANGEGIVVADELPEGAVPLVAVPVVEMHREGDYIVSTAGAGGYRYTLERADEQIDYLRTELGRVLGAREFLERESSARARQKVLQDLKPGIYNLRDEQPGSDHAHITITLEPAEEAA